MVMSMFISLFLLLVALSVAHGLLFSTKSAASRVHLTTPSQLKLRVPSPCILFCEVPRKASDDVIGLGSASVGGVATVEQEDSRLSRWFNPNTRGGVIVWSFLLLVIPCGAYNYFVSTGLEETKVGAYVGAIFVLVSNLLWASTYLFRVATKDMTYANQLREYENAVLQKRLEELADDEITALMEEIENETKEGRKEDF